MPKLDPDNPRLRTFEQIEPELREGDVMLYRTKRMFGIGGLIRRATGGIHSHAEMLCLIRGRWHTCGMVEGTGFSSEPLDEYARKYPGKIDLFHPAPHLRVNGDEFWYDGCDAAEYMRGLRGWKYGWRGIWKLVLMKAPGLWFFVGWDTADDPKEDGAAAFCSHAVSAAMMAGGVDPVPNCPNNRVTPHMLFTSLAIGHGYYGTLTA